MNSRSLMVSGGLLGTVFVLMTVSILSEGIFKSEAPEKPGYALAGGEAAGAGAGAAPAEAAAKPVEEVLAKADPAKGEAVFKKCTSCHDNGKGGPNKVGPNLWGVVGRKIASHEGFSYSAGIKDFSKGGSEVWSFDHLYKFLAGPKKYVAGTAMGFAGIAKDEDRADLIAYLNSASDSPLPLPGK